MYVSRLTLPGRTHEVEEKAVTPLGREGETRESESHAHSLWLSGEPALESPAGAWVPSVNVVETDRVCWVITALPGAEPGQIEISLQDNQLVITGTRSLPACCLEGELKIWEIPHGRFARRLRLTPGVKFTLGAIEFAEGLLIAEVRKS